MNDRLALRVGAVLGGLAVAAGAFGAHALASRLPAEDLTIYETAVRYQVYHALALVLCAALPARTAVAAAAFAAGSVIFSGTLYVLVLTGARWLGAITPIGGTLLIVGWIALALGPTTGLSSSRPPSSGTRSRTSRSPHR